MKPIRISFLKSNRLALVILLVLFEHQRGAESHGDAFINSGSGYLPNAIFEITIYSILQCAHRCQLKKSTCKSYSFNKSIKRCKAHGNRLEDSGIALIPHTEWQYYEVIAASGSQQNPLTSCKDLIGSSKPSGFYWLKYPEGGLVFETYCDMDAGGGWLQIAGFGLHPNYASIVNSNFLSSAEFLFLTTNVDDLQSLKSNTDVALASSTVRKLVEVTGARQLRMYCSSGTTLHLVTTKDEVGDAVLKYFTNLTDTVRPSACNSFNTLSDDDSRLTKECSNWGYDGIWGHKKHFMTSEYKLYNYLAFKANAYHIVGNILCDDNLGQNSNIAKKWKYYIR